MAACTLDVGSRRVLVSEEGPPAAEFALFDASDIELAPADGGALREVGYRTTSAEALRRLAVAGITLDLAEECARIVRGPIAEAYARGPFARRVAPLLGPGELFEGGTYDATLRRYEGTWLDLPLIANDAGIASATGVLHAASLVALLSEVSGDAPVVLTTLGHSESLRLGERTLRRHAIDAVASVPRALRHLIDHAPAAQHTGEGPGRDQLAAALRERLQACVQSEAREHLLRLERALNERPRPSHGPLADPVLWEAERLLTSGNTAAALNRVEAREAAHGREPATIYLRARAALIQGKESPRVIAQRVGEMALSMHDFHEVELLAAQAWNAAGETRNALPFARDLVANPRVHDELRAAAESILRSPRVPIDSPMSDRDFEASESGDLQPVSQAPPPPAMPRSERPAPSSQVPPRISDRPASPIARSVPPPQVVVHDERIELPFSRTPSEPPPRPRSLTPPELPPMSAAPSKDARRYLTPPERMASPLPPRASGSVAPPRVSPSIPPVRFPGSGPPPSIQPATPRPGRASPSSPPQTGRRVQPEPWPTALRAPREERFRPEEIEHTPAGPRVLVSQRFMRGASMPPVAYEQGSSIPRPSVVPRVDVDEPELLETLPLPRGASEATIEPHVVPRTPLEARIRFTADARELARRYRHDQGLELRLEPRTVQVLQRHLAERFTTRVVATPEEAREAELHGALLSELLARLLGAEWNDIAPTELGYWAMVIPTKGGDAKRVWPFGRVLRFIASGGEDDLVAFFRKLRELG